MSSVKISKIIFFLNNNIQICIQVPTLLKKNDGKTLKFK